MSLLWNAVFHVLNTEEFLFLVHLKLSWTSFEEISQTIKSSSGVLGAVLLPCCMLFEAFFYAYSYNGGLSVLQQFSWLWKGTSTGFLVRAQEIDGQSNAMSQILCRVHHSCTMNAESNHKFTSLLPSLLPWVGKERTWFSDVGLSLFSSAAITEDRQKTLFGLRFIIPSDLIWSVMKHGMKKSVPSSSYA